MKSYHEYKAKNQRNRQSESGNVLFFILIAVVLFGALSFVVSNMMRGGSIDTIGEEKAKLYAGEILDYGRIVRQAVQNIKISNGCTIATISFENNVVAGYTNGSTTMCHVFKSNGGGISWTSPPPEALNNDVEWLFPSNINASGYGNGGADMLIMLTDIKLSVCNEINSKLNNGYSTPPTDTGGWNANGKFTGSLGAAGQALDCDPGNKCPVPQACVNILNYDGNGPNYVYFLGLSPRN